MIFSLQDEMSKYKRESISENTQIRNSEILLFKKIDDFPLQDEFSKNNKGGH